MDTNNKSFLAAIKSAQAGKVGALKGYLSNRVRGQSLSAAIFPASGCATPLRLSVLVTGIGELMLGTLVHAKGSLRQGGLLIFPKDAFTGAMLSNGSRSENYGSICEDRILAMIDELGIHPTERRTNLTFAEAAFLGWRPLLDDAPIKVVQKPVKPGRRRKGQKP
jgi:hypothetical protein